MDKKNAFKINDELKKNREDKYQFVNEIENDDRKVFFDVKEYFIILLVLLYYLSVYEILESDF